jgi:hypothetical protein
MCEVASVVGIVSRYTHCQQKTSPTPPVVTHTIPPTHTTPPSLLSLCRGTRTNAAQADRVTKPADQCDVATTAPTAKADRGTTAPEMRPTEKAAGVLS